MQVVDLYKVVNTTVKYINIVNDITGEELYMGTPDNIPEIYLYAEVTTLSLPIYARGIIKLYVSL